MRHLTHTLLSLIVATFTLTTLTACDEATKIKNAVTAGVKQAKDTYKEPKKPIVTKPLKLKNPSEQRLDAEISAANKQLPLTIDECTILKSLTKESSCIVYSYTLKGITVSDVPPAYWNTMRQSAVHQLSLPACSQLISYLRATNRNIKYHYTDQTGHSHDFYVSTDEI